MKETSNKLEKLLLNNANSAEKALYKDGSIELAKLERLQNLTDIKSNYGYDIEGFSDDVSKSAKDLLKLQDPGLSSTRAFNEITDEIKKTHPDLVDFIKNDLIPTVKQHDEISDKAYQFVKQSQVKTPEEILLLLNKLKEFKPESSTLKKQKEDVIKRLNEKLLVGLKDRERTALAKIQEKQESIKKASDLLGTDFNDQTITDKIAASEKVRNITAEDKGMKKVASTGDELLNLLKGIKPEKSKELIGELAEAQKGHSLAKMHAHTPDTIPGHIAKAMTTTPLKVTEGIAALSKDMNAFIKNSANNQVIENLMNKAERLPISQTTSDFKNKLRIILSKEGQSRKALLYTLSQRPEYRNLIKELLDDEKEK